MKTFVKTICVGNFYCFCIYKITDFVGQTYYVAEPVLHGVTRCAGTEEELVKILNADVAPLNEMQRRTR